ncbi:membrane protein insertase YidC [Pseudomonas sp. F1_0610]|uniref:membrane protein insertase YidC n=1 Tax=Pseudomonas sp. F1_0610 TaxID=3114284 RepID=UPI0039C17605
MDIQRTILIVALAVVSYVMVLKWNEDYDKPQAVQSNPVATQQSTSDIPTASNTASNNDDVPTAINSSDTPVAVANTVVSDNLITVKTDIMSIKIDPRGGDIVDNDLLLYAMNKSQPDIPFKLLENNTARLYVAQSGLVGTNGPDATIKGRPLYSTTQSSYQLVDGQDQLVVDLTLSKDGVNYIKRFTFYRGLDSSCSAKKIAELQTSCLNKKAYEVDVKFIVQNTSSQAWNGNFYTQIKRDKSGDPSSAGAASTATYLGAAVWTPSEPYTKIKMGTMDDKNFSEKVQGGWVAWLQHYFVTAWVSDKDQHNTVTTRKDNAGNYIVGLMSNQVTIPAGQTAEMGATLYSGPKIQSHLKELSPGLELTVDYGFLWFLAQPIFWLLNIIHSLFGNWGWSIIGLTVLIKLIFFPLSAASYRSMARMRAVAPKMQALKEQYGDDRQKMSQAMMELYKKEKINPLGGCLPLLLQMPVFLALYWVLLESVEMRQAPWMFWITDLSSKDPFFILPIIMGLSMFVQQHLNPTPPDPMQAKVMKLLPIIFTFFFLWFPAGLVLYWVVNNVLSIAQQWVITRKIEKAAAEKAH